MDKNSKVGIFIEKDKKPGPRKPGKGNKEPKWFKPFKQTVLLFIKTQSEFNKNQDKFNKTILERLDNLVVKNNLVE